MTETWLIQDIERHINHRNRVVVLDPSGQCGFLLNAAVTGHYIILQTDNALTEEWQRVKEELFLRYDAETTHKNAKVIFYVTRPQKQMSFLFDYCFTHGCIDLTNPADWLRKKIFSHTGLQIKMDNPLLFTAAKVGVGKDLTWWKKILQNLEQLISVEDELLPFLNDPENYLNNKESDVRQLFEAKVFELLGQPYMAKPPKTIAAEVANLLFDKLLCNDINTELLGIYLKWLDSNIYSESLKDYVDRYKLDKYLNIWNLHPDHCFPALDYSQLQKITANFRDASFVKEKLVKIKLRLKSQRAIRFIPAWWQDIISLIEFDNKPLAKCNTADALIEFYTKSFYKVDRAIRNLYTEFLQDDEVVRPLQEYYESLNHELLQHWFDLAGEYKPNQQGYLVNLIKQSKPGIAIIVGDGVRYEIAAFVASQLEKKVKVDWGTMLADMPSETEHNMSALYVGGNQIVPVHDDREKKLTASTGKKITFLNLESLHQGIQADYLVLTYKDIDKTGENLQMGALKLFNEFEKILAEKIQLLLTMKFNEVHLVTDHGFVLTGLLDEADKILPNATGKKDVGERYIRTGEKQTDSDWIMFNKPYGEFNYVYAAKSHRPFKSKGVYGYSHGGFTPQEIIIPKFSFTRPIPQTSALQLYISNKRELSDVTGDFFIIRLDAPRMASDIFSNERKVQIKLYANNIEFQTSDIITMHPNDIKDKEFSFNHNVEVYAVVVDASTQYQIDSVNIKQSSVRDLGGLL